MGREDETIENGELKMENENSLPKTEFNSTFHFQFSIFNFPLFKVYLCRELNNIVNDNDYIQVAGV